jgi:hypothetical protein
MSTITSITINAKSSNMQKLIDYINEFDEFCIGGSYIDDFYTFRMQDNTLCIRINVRGFIQFYDIKTDSLLIFKDFTDDVDIDIDFENLDYCIYGKIIKAENDNKYLCKYLDEQDVENVLYDYECDFDSIYITLDEYLENRFEFIML